MEPKYSENNNILKDFALASYTENTDLKELRTGLLT
jgi:hypothetical protein